MTATRVDAVVLGAGVNGLVAARYLARAGRRVLVVDQDKDGDRPGASGWVPPTVVRDLGLERQGLKIERPDPWITAPLDGGGRLELWRDMMKSVDAIQRISPADAARWPEFCARMRRLAGVLEALYVQPAPDVETREVGELLRMARLGWRVRRLGKEAIVDLLRILPMSVGELLDDWFQNDVLKGVLGALGVWHLKQGPRSGGTAFNFLHHLTGCPVGVFRPERSNLRDVLLAMPGVDVRKGSAVVLVKGGRATGAVFAPSGDAVEAPLVISGAAPRATFEPLARELDPEFVRAIRNIKAQGVVARGSLRPNHPPDFTTLCVAPSLEYLERAYDDAKYGRSSARPYVEAHAVNGQLELHVQYALAGDRTLAERVVAALGAPAQAAQLTLETPEHLYHGDLTLDQILFMRPVPGWSRYRTPVEGLYLCGPGTHPGGGVAGAAGRNAARVILKETKGR